MQHIEHHASFGGWQDVYQHESNTLNCSMKFSIYLPPHQEGEKLPVLYWLSGLTCNEQNFIQKAGAQKYAAEHKIIIVAPDTSPRGEEIANDSSYDLGQGAGFYINATQQPWAQHFRMYDYIVKELPELIEHHFPVNHKRGIFGHSMGGHGALMIALKNPNRYHSVSAFSPIVAPSQVPWGQKAFSTYLGEDKILWQDYDSTELVKNFGSKLTILIDQGKNDEFLSEQLKPLLFAQACKEKNVNLQLDMHDHYDHSYYFIASFIEKHLKFHLKQLSDNIESNMDK